MSDSLSIFKDWCKDAFRFLSEKHAFALLQEGRQYDSYYVLFGHGDVKLGVCGEGYSSVATVHYITSTGFEVPYQCLNPGWQPAIGKRRKKTKGPEMSQQQQIFHAAKVISERDEDILRGDMSRVNAAAQRLQAIYERLKKR